MPAETFTIPETVTVDGRAAFETMVSLLKDESLLDFVGGIRAVSGDYVSNAIAELWAVLFGNMFIGDDVDPVPLYREAERRRDAALIEHVGRWYPELSPLLGEQFARVGGEG